MNNNWNINKLTMICKTGGIHN